MASQQAGRTRTIIVRLNIDSEELLKLYRGSARNVSTMSLDGQNVRFPAEALKPFVTHHGVQGQFALVVDANNKLLDLHRLKSHSTRLRLVVWGADID